MAQNKSDNFSRFTDRVDNYVKYRPTYPKEVIDTLRQQGINDGHLIADIGAGTGIFTKILLENGFKVVAVEPNDKMRAGQDAPPKI